MILIFIQNRTKKSAITKESKQFLTLFNWGEYLDPQTIIDFEEQNGIEVKQVLFSSNELAITKIKSDDKYDLAILSEYAIDKLIQDELIEGINSEKLEKSNNYNWQYNDQYKEFKEKLPKRFSNYAVPYFWGKVVLIYNKQKINKEEITKESFKILDKPNLKIALCNNPRDGLMVGLKATGGTIEKPTEKELENAKKWLLKLKEKNPNVAFINDQLIDRMSQKGKEYYDVVVAYSGDANFLKEKNDNLEVLDPKEGTNVWVDSLVMPKNSCKELAYKFINFLREKNNYQKNLAYIKYDSPYKDKNNKIKINENDQIYKYDEANQKLINTYWNDVIAYPSKKDYWLFGFSGLILIGLIIAFFMKKRKVFESQY